MKFALRAFAHMVVYVLIVAVVRELSNPKYAEALASGFVGGWIVQALQWKRRFQDLDGRVDGTVDKIKPNGVIATKDLLDKLDKMFQKSSASCSRLGVSQDHLIMGSGYRRAIGELLTFVMVSDGNYDTELKEGSEFRDMLRGDE